MFCVRGGNFTIFIDKKQLKWYNTFTKLNFTHKTEELWATYFMLILIIC